MEATVKKQQMLTSLRETIESYSEEFLTHTFDPNNPQVRLHEPTYGAEEIWEALESLLTTRVTMSEKVRRFEKDFAEYFGFSYTMMVNSGSSANLLAISALSNPAISSRFNAGDEVIVPALSWSTTIWPIIQHNLVPVIVDIDLLTLNIDPNEVERALSAKTRGIMPVHVYGNPCDMAAIMDIVNRHSLILVEDCCEAIGASYGGKPVGSFGSIGTFSFYFSHHITTLEGGMCVTDDFDLAEMMRILRAHGWIRENLDKERYTSANPTIHPRFLFANLGYNLRPTELQGGFGSAQLKKLQSFLEIRAKNARYWRKKLDTFGNFFEFQEETRGGVHSWFGFPMAVKESAPFSVVGLTDFLNQRGIETRPIIAGNIAVQPAMQYYEHGIVGNLSNSNHIMRNGFTFGNHQAIDERARQYIVDTIREFLSTKGLV